MTMTIYDKLQKSNKIKANPLLTWHRLPTVILAETWAF